MNREIKFRAWNKYLHVMEEDVHVLGRFAEILSRDQQYIVMQYTCLKDKNDKEIYEGDILEKTVTDYDHEDYRTFVDSGYETIEPTKTIRDYCTLTKFRLWLNDESFGYEGEDLENPEEWAVIGNIYENPELLK